MIIVFSLLLVSKIIFCNLPFWEIAASKKSLTFSLSVAEGDENLYRPICLKQMMSLCIPTYRSRINLMQTEHTCLGWTSCLYLPKEVMIIKSTTDLLRRKLNGTNFDQVLTRIHGNEMRGSFVNRKFLVL